jgi:antitoxin (DNA-binding transcriptional repressor) of toxin-antitoxin stability system
MQIAGSKAKARLSELVHRAQAGERIILTRRGHPVAGVEVMPGKFPAEAEVRQQERLSQS